MKKTILIALLALGLVATTGADGTVLLNAAGATFPYPIYSKWFDVYHNAHPNVQINYQSIGSGGGIRQLQSGTVDFGASDGPMTDRAAQSVQGKDSALPHGVGRGSADVQHPGIQRRSELHTAGDCRHLSGKNHQVERSRNRRRPIRASNFRTTISSWCTAPMAAAPPTS